MLVKNVFFKLFVLLCVSIVVKCQVDLRDYFGKCQLNSSEFDTCVRDGINDLRPYFKTGLSEYGIRPFDPFYATEIPQKRSGPFFNYKLVLRNVTESGWTASQITNFKTDFTKNNIQFTHFFPDKKLEGWYEIDGTFLGTKVNNQGSWNLGLYDYTQTMSVTRKPIRDAQGQIVDSPIKVKVNLQNCKKLELHIGHLLGGRTIFENMLDRIINTAWQPGFIILSPLINDLVSTAFTEIFNKDFENFPFDQVFPY